MNLCLVFDLDQTLVRGEATDWTCYLDACEEALGVSIQRDDDWATYPVLTDFGLLDGLSRRYRGCAAAPTERQHMSAGFLRRLDEALAAVPDRFVPVDGAIAMLEVFAAEARVGIATGNMRPALERKLRSSGLDRFALPAVCSEDVDTRADLVRTCLARLGHRSGDNAVSVGDGEWDVDAAAVVGVPFLGVAATPEREARLRARGAREIITDFKDLADVHARIGRLIGG